MRSGPSRAGERGTTRRPIHSAVTPYLRRGGINQLKAGVVRRFAPGLLQKSGLPDADACTSDFEASQHPVRPHFPERLFVSYEGRLRLLRGSLVDVAEQRR